MTLLTILLRKPLLGHHQYLLRKIKAWLVNLKVKDLVLVFIQLLSHDTPYLDIFPVYQLKEIDMDANSSANCWYLTSCFQEHYPSMYAIIVGSEIYIATPTDLPLESSTWSSCKHHNTAKFLIACTPNGCVTFISPLYMDSISDIEFTGVSGFLNCVQNKADILVMADRGFAIKDMQEVGIELNSPPFMEE